jgi:flagellin-specific chaperone FliS
MNPHLRYQQTQTLSWTRVDMLLTIYDHVVSALTEGAVLLEQGKGAQLIPIRIRAQKALLAVADGLDLEQGELPTQVLRLVVFALDQVRTDDAVNWRSAARVMNTLRDGFAEIQDQARVAEYDGRIPALDAVRV